jgi:hypothetical protein
MNSQAKTTACVASFDNDGTYLFDDANGMIHS